MHLPPNKRLVAVGPDGQFSPAIEAEIGNIGGESVAAALGWTIATSRGVKGDGVTDNTAALTELLATSEGKRIYFPPGVYITGPVACGKNRAIVGAGVGLTTLKLKAGTDGTLLTLSDASGSLLTDLTLDGNRVANTSTTSSALLIDTTPGNLLSSYYLTVDRIVVQEAANNGITIPGNNGEPGGWYNWVYQLSNISIKNVRGYGLYDESSDNRYSNFYLTECDKADVYLKGASTNLYANFKIGEGGRTNATTVPTKTDGACMILDNAVRCMFANIDLQSGFRDGLYAKDCRNLILNGVDSQNHKGWGFYFHGCRSITGTVSTSATVSFFNTAGDFFFDATSSDIELQCTPPAYSGSPSLIVSNNGARCYVRTPARRGTVAPTTGSGAVGEVVWNSAPAPSGFIGWVCVAAGTPGTWKTFGAISA